MGYESPIALMFQADEKKRYGDDASLQIYPFRLDGEEAEKLQQAERNREVLQLLFSLSNSLFGDKKADRGVCGCAGPFCDAVWVFGIGGGGGC